MEIFHEIFLSENLCDDVKHQNNKKANNVRVIKLHCLIFPPAELIIVMTQHSEHEKCVHVYEEVKFMSTFNNILTSYLNNSF